MIFIYIILILIIILLGAINKHTIELIRIYKKEKEAKNIIRQMSTDEKQEYAGKIQDKNNEEIFTETMKLNVSDIQKEL